jgi:asparagine synthetase B (glutamine-hydrolysing)
VAGLAGIVDLYNESPAGLMEAMLASLRRVDGLGSDRASFAQAELGVIRRGRAAQVACSEGSALAFFGVLAGEDRLRAGAPTLADALLQRYQLGGVAALQGMNGSYAIAVWDSRARSLTLVKDRIGSANLYYWHSGGQFVFASELKAVACHPSVDREPDAQGVVDFFLWSHPLDERTLARGVRSVPSDGLVCFADGQITVSRGPGVTVGEYRRGRPDDWIDEWADRVRLAVSQVLVPGAALLVTGGLDSRLVAEAARQVAPELSLRTATVGLKGCKDSEIGAQVATELGYPHTHVPLGNDYFERYAARTAWRGEGKLSAFAGWIYAGEEELRRWGVSRVLTGLLGNTLSGRHFPEELAMVSSVSQGVGIIERRASGGVAELCRVLRSELHEAGVRASLQFWDDAFRNSSAHDLYGRFDDANLRGDIARAAQKEEVLGDAADPADPLFDLDLLEFSLSLPPWARAGGKLYRAMIARHFPRVAGLPVGRSGRSVTADAWLDTHPRLGRAERLARRAVRRVGARWSSDAAGSNIRPNEALRSQSRRFVHAALADEALYEDLFDPRAVRQVLNDHMDGRRKSYWLISGLLTFALWRAQLADHPAAGGGVRLPKNEGSQALCQD